MKCCTVKGNVYVVCKCQIALMQYYKVHLFNASVLFWGTCTLP